MKLFNTMSMQKEEFVPIEPGKVRMYACGPTVYNYIHVGNARPIIMFDVLRRYLEYRGYEVTFVQNFTDVDDKIIKRANEEGITSEEVAIDSVEMISFSGVPVFAPTISRALTAQGIFIFMRLPVMNAR